MNIGLPYDFADFEAGVAEMNRLSRAFHMASETAIRTRAPEDIQRHRECVARWQEYSGFGREAIRFYAFESDSYLQSLAAGGRAQIESAIRYLEYDPYYHRSGYIKGKLLNRLKHLVLGESERTRLRVVIENAIVSPWPKAEFFSYRKLAPHLFSIVWVARLEALPVPANPWNQKRKTAILECLQVVK